MNTEHIVRVTGFAASTLDGAGEMADIAEEMGDEDAPMLRAVAKAYQRGALRFNRADADLLARGLGDLSNGEDDYAEDRNHQRTDPEGVRMARAAAGGLATLMTKVSQALR